MKLRKPGPLSAADKTWLRSYQTDKGAQADGIFGRETLDHIKADLALLHQPDDPGADLIGSEGLGRFPNRAAILFVGVATILTVAVLAWAIG